MQEFYINQESTMPFLKMELINDGRYDFDKFYELIQDADITFTMTNSDTGVIKVANQKALIESFGVDTCSEKYYIYYKWKKRDTKLKGKYTGKFKITFGNYTSGDNISYENEELLVPIQEELIIYIQ